MKTLSRASIVVLSIFLNVPVNAEEEPRGSLKMEAADSSQQLLNRSLEVYREMTQSKRVPSSVLKNAKCVAIFPDVITAAIGVGGTGGDGIAMCRNVSDSKWSNPVYLNLAGGSLGLQAGVKSTDLVMYMTGDKARQAIQEGSFKVAGDLSAVAGSYDETFVAPPSGVVAYANTEGVFAGASVVGVSLNHDTENQRSVYGTYKSDAVFDTKTPESIRSRVEQLQQALPS